MAPKKTGNTPRMDPRREPYNSTLGLVVTPVRRSKTPSNGPTYIQFKPNPEGIRDYCQAITQYYMASNLLGNSAYDQSYNDFFRCNHEIIVAGMRGDPVPPFNPCPWPTAMIFHMFNTPKKSAPVAGGHSIMFSMSDWNFPEEPPQVRFGQASMTPDANGFGVLPPYDPGNPDERRETWQLIMSASSKLRQWKVGDPVPSWVHGTSQFATIVPANTHGAPLVNQHNNVAHSFLPIQHHLLAFLNLVQVEQPVENNTVLGLYKIPLLGTPQLYAGYFATTYSPDLRIHLDCAIFRIEEVAAMLIGVYDGINRQRGVDGLTPLFQDLDPVYFYAYLCSLIATSQIKFSPFTVDTRGGDPTLRSILFGTQYPPQDFTALSNVPGPLLLIEYLRRVNNLTIEVPWNGRLVNCVIVPIFAHGPDILGYLQRALDYADIGYSSTAINVDISTWRNPVTGTYLSYAPRILNDPGSLGWGKYCLDLLKIASEYSPYMATRFAHPARDFRFNPAAYFHAYVSTEDFLLSVDTALEKRRTGNQPLDRTTARLREFQIAAGKLLKPAAKKGEKTVAESEPIRLENLAVATCTYHEFGQRSALFSGLPIARRPIRITDPAGINLEITKQILSVNQITPSPNPVHNDPSYSAFYLGRTSVGSSKKDTPATELMQYFQNEAEAGNGGAYETALNGAEDLSKLIYASTGKRKNKGAGRTKQDMERFGKAMKTTKKIVEATTKPVARIVNKVLS